MTLLEEIIEYKKTPNALRDRYVAFVTDATQSLDERWEVFKEAPTEWKNEKSYIEHFDAEKLLPGGEVSWYDDFYIEKYETVDMVGFVEERLIDHLMDHFDFDIDDELPEEVQVIVDAFKCEVLAKNMASFKFDW